MTTWRALSAVWPTKAPLRSTRSAGPPLRHAKSPDERHLDDESLLRSELGRGPLLTLGWAAIWVSRSTCRFLIERRLDGLHDEPRSGKPRTITADDVERVIVKTFEETPAAATHWSTRSMAARHPPIGQRPRRLHLHLDHKLE